jgi:tRNA-specific 2-thiouridylase
MHITLEASDHPIDCATIQTVVVAMSGGVDSSVAAYLLAKQGIDCIGISMQVWDYRNNGGSCTRATCCAPDDFTDARKVAAIAGVPYYVFDFEKTFRKEVIDQFVQTYARGETPNPCIECNNKVKFRELRDRAAAFGCSHVATGHYARVRQTSDGWYLLRGKDTDKDQSYFLYGLKQSELAQTLFPVGDMTKDEVRQIAKDAGLVTHSKPESQDICFVSGSVQDFLVKIGGAKKSGQIVDRLGNTLGEHEGIDNYTVGQRKGLRLGGLENPLYVLELDPYNNKVIVGSKAELERSEFNIKEVNWITPKPLTEPFKAIAQLRHRHKGVEVWVQPDSESNTCKVKFENEWTTVSPGQSCVFYDLSNQIVLGGGRIVNH